MANELFDAFEQRPLDIDKLHGWLEDGSLDQWTQGPSWEAFWEDYRSDDARSSSQYALDEALDALINSDRELSPSKKLLDLVSFFCKKGANRYKVPLDALSDEEYVCVALKCYLFASLYDKDVVVRMNARLEKAKDISTWSWNGQSILACALWGNAPVELVKKLLELGANPFDARTDVSMYVRPLLVNQITCVGDVEDIIFDAMVDQMEDCDLSAYEPLDDVKKEGLEAAQARKLKKQLQEAIPEAEGKKEGDGKGMPLKKKPL
jgi:hypothetical protein